MTFPIIPRLPLQVAFIAAALVPHLVLEAQEPYKQPPDPIAQILDADPRPAVSLSPDRAWLLMMERNSLPTIAEVAAPELRLGGSRIDPRSNAGSRQASFKALRLRSVHGSIERTIKTPAGARITGVLWSPDSRSIAFTIGEDSAVTLWLAEATSGQARSLTPAKLNGATGFPCAWVDSSQLACLMIVANRGDAPLASGTPKGPVVQQSMGRSAANRTYQDLLSNPADEATFEHFFTSQVVLVSKTGEVTPVGSPGIHVSASPSPDGRYLLMHTLHRPFSYVVPMSEFPTRIEVWNMSGVVVKQLADLPLQEEVGTAFDAVAKGPRNVSWRADAPATIVWTEALDEGNPSREVAKRDRLQVLAAPFTDAPTVVMDVGTRIRAVRWARSDLALVDEFWWKTRKVKTWAVNPARPSAEPRLVFDRLSEDRYGDPGSFVMTVGPLGTRVLLTTANGRSAYLAGSGASAKGDVPFLDRMDLASGKTERLWQSASPYYEEIVALLDPNGRQVLTLRESVNDAPNYFVRDVRGGKFVRLTNIKDPAPQLGGIAPQLITYKRADGVQLSAKLYLPPNYDKSKGRLPFFFWAYPQEFKTAAAAAQIQGSPYRFVRPAGASHLLLLTQGYGVLDGPTMPIVGEGDKEPNDTYVEQLVGSAKAAVDKVVELGVADRQRIGVGGHSYGAFMTANLLAHSDIFRAGIARSGAYNRTLTPFGFQAEERPFWRAREIYASMSPFFFADKINEPILLIHGGADDNSGTFPVQSERMYAALAGNGATVRYVVLPAEAHGYRARESVGHTLWEMVTWLDTHVKNPIIQ
ncbi:MAG: S9 family peptidase [Gemmatimonadaceae bacterium]|nr:S9 family peptidase [Gemmatimonadaceae bacterium]